MSRRHSYAPNAPQAMLMRILRVAEGTPEHKKGDAWRIPLHAGNVSVSKGALWDHVIHPYAHFIEGMQTGDAPILQDKDTKIIADNGTHYLKITDSDLQRLKAELNRLTTTGKWAQKEGVDGNRDTPRTPPSLPSC